MFTCRVGGLVVFGDLLAGGVVALAYVVVGVVFAGLLLAGVGILVGYAAEVSNPNKDRRGRPQL